MYFYVQINQLNNQQVARRIFYTYILLSLAMVLWAFSFIWFKIANETYPPVTIVFFRLFFASVLLLVFSFSGGYFKKIAFYDLKHFFWLALFNPFLYFIGESNGLTYVSSTTAAVIVGTMPLFVPFAAYYLFKERLSWLNYSGIMASFAGVVMVVVNKDLQFTADPRGIALMFLATFSAVVYTLLLRKVSLKYHPIAIITLQNSIGTILFLPLFLIFDLKEVLIIPLSFHSVLPVFELAVFASAIAFIFYTYGIRSLGASRTSIFTNTIPVLTAVLSFYLLGEVFRPGQIIGILLVIGGLFLSQLKKKVSN